MEFENCRGYWFGKNGIREGAIHYLPDGSAVVMTDDTHGIPLEDMLTSASFHIKDENGRQLL